MLKYIAKRLLHLAGILVAISFLTFLLMYLAPGDAAVKKLNAQGIAVSQEVLDKTRADMGLDRPFLVQYGDWAWKALREKGILKAVLIGSAIAILGQFMGVNAVLYYGPKIFADAGFPNPLFSTVLVGVVNMLTTVIALLIIDKVGRKQLVWWGVGGMIVCLLMIGLYFLPSTNLPNWFMLTFFLLYVFCTAISISAVVFVLLSEMYPNRVRGLAMSIAGLALWVGTYLIGQLTPWMLENLTPAGTFFLFAFMCLPYLWIMYKYVPNTTGKTLEEIEDYWRAKN